MACRRWPVTIPECSASGGAEESQFPAGRCVRARRLTRPSYHRFWREMDNSWSVWAARFPLVADTTTYHRHSQSLWTAKFALHLTFLLAIFRLGYWLPRMKYSIYWAITFQLEVQESRAVAALLRSKLYAIWGTERVPSHAEGLLPTFLCRMVVAAHKNNTEYEYCTYCQLNLKLRVEMFLYACSWKEEDSSSKEPKNT